MDGFNGVGKPRTLFSDFEATASGLQYKVWPPRKCITPRGTCNYIAPRAWPAWPALPAYARALPHSALRPPLLSAQDYKSGSGPLARAGDRVTLEWGGVTVGYQGRYFQERYYKYYSALRQDKN